jgi:hypothetical protein
MSDRDAAARTEQLERRIAELEQERRVAELELEVAKLRHELDQLRFAAPYIVWPAPPWIIWPAPPWIVTSGGTSEVQEEVNPACVSSCSSPASH